MATRRRVEFGYNPPTGDRNLEQVVSATFVTDLQHTLDIASQSFSSIWISDHHMTGDRFRIECWSQLMWVAARYPGPMLGTCVMSNLYRHPPLLAKMVASLQTLSHGRFIFGYGAGWLEAEYRAYGYEFPSARTRIAQLDDGIRVIKALWTESPATYTGPYYQVRDAYCEPRPDPLPPLMIAGDGEKFLLRVVAEHADWWLTYGRRAEEIRHKTAILEQHCRDVGRDPSTIKRAYPLVTYLKRDRGEAERWAGAALEREMPAFAGDPAMMRDRIRELVDLGIDQFQIAFAGFPNTDDMRLFVDEVLPAFQ